MGEIKGRRRKHILLVTKFGCHSIVMIVIRWQPNFMHAHPMVIKILIQIFKYMSFKNFKNLDSFFTSYFVPVGFCVFHCTFTIIVEP
jgi:hypothetical protein